MFGKLRFKKQVKDKIAKAATRAFGDLETAGGVDKFKLVDSFVGVGDAISSHYGRFTPLEAAKGLVALQIFEMHKLDDEAAIARWEAISDQLDAME